MEKKDKVERAERTGGGSVRIADEVVGIIAGLAATEVAGIAGMSAGLVGGIAEMLGRKNLSKETILQKVWGYDTDAVENNVEVYVGFLRKKLARTGSNVRISSIRRMGYHLEVQAGEL